MLAELPGGGLFGSRLGASNAVAFIRSENNQTYQSIETMQEIRLHALKRETTMSCP